MTYSTDFIKVLVVEDNEGDFIIIEELLAEEIKHPQIVRAESLTQTIEILREPTDFNVILLDLSLSDASGENLVKKVLEFAGQIPVIVLTGYHDKSFGISTLAWGVSDFMLKDDLQSFQLYKSISYGIERKKVYNELAQSEHKYRSLFHLSPIPMWVFDAETFQFLNVNEAAVRHYGYSREEFLAMTIKDIRPPEDIPVLLESDAKYSPEIRNAGVFRHIKKDGTNLYAEIIVNQITFDGKKSRIVLANDITERVIAENALKAAIKREHAMIENALDVICTIDAEGKFVSVSPACFKVWGYQPEELIGQTYIEIVAPEDVEMTNNAAIEIMSGIEMTDFENCCRHKNGSLVYMSWTALWSPTDRLMFCVAHDITATKKLTEQLRQSQKLESVGLLAGGIAHDFNNMLTAINGYSELTLRKLKANDPLRLNIEEIKKAGQRSLLLTQQLLAFSRQQILKPMVLDLNEVLTDTMQMLERLIGEDIHLKTELNRLVGRVRFDPGQLTQIILNLVVNARDAMPQGGRLTIETNNVYLDPEYARRHIGALPGDYILLAVSDTGSGMSDEVKNRVFEPFFTTKEVGRGTGLGLATVYGIVKQSGGNIEVYSEKDVGTTFKVYLPRVVEEAPPAKKSETSQSLPKGNETILLVEDEELVRNLTRQILEDSGYEVIEAADGIEALNIFDKSERKFDLLLTDVVMPKMSGRELAEKLKAKMPDLRILFTSGYTDDAVVRHGVIEADTNFIQKPFTPETLAVRIRKIFDTSETKL